MEGCAKETILNGLRRRPWASLQNLTFDVRCCPSPSCDSGNYSNCELIGATCADAINTNDDLILCGDDQSQKLMFAQQIISKLKNELLCLKRSEKWYRNELKVQKQSRVDTLEKLYIREHGFLKTNQSLELKCQELRNLYNQIKSKSKKEKELLLKQTKKDFRHDHVLHDIAGYETSKYNVQKLNKIKEEHEALIEVLRKQKQNLLVDLHNLTSEKDSKIMLIEKKNVILEKENFMLVEKCKDLILESRKLRNVGKNNMNINKDKIEELQVMEILQLNSPVLSIDECKSENKPNNQIKKFNFDADQTKCIEEINRLFDNDEKAFVKLQNEHSGYEQICERNVDYPKFNKQGYKISRKRDSQIFEDDGHLKDRINEIEFLRQNFYDICDKHGNILNNVSGTYKNVHLDETELKSDKSKIVLNEICNPKLLNNFFNIKEKHNFQANPKEVMRICFYIIDELNVKLNIFQEKSNRNQSIISQIFDKDTVVAKISYDAYFDNNVFPNQFVFDLKETAKKNKLLHKLYLQNFETLADNFDTQNLNEFLKKYNNFALNQEQNSITDLTRCQNLNNGICPNNVQAKTTSQKVSFSNQTEDISGLGALLVSQEKVHKNKLSRHQDHVRFLLSNIKSYKKKLENLNDKFASLVKKNSNLEKELMESDKIKNNLNIENYNSKTEIANLKKDNQKHYDEIKKLTYLIQTAEIHFNEIVVQKNLNADLKNNLTNLIDDYKLIIKTQESLRKSIKSNINYAEIYGLINRSNNSVPTLEKVCKAVDGIKSDMRILMEKGLTHSNSRTSLFKNNTSGSAATRLNQQKSLMDELEEVKHY